MTHVEDVNTMTPNDHNVLGRAQGALRKLANQANSPKIARLLRNEASRLVEFEARLSRSTLIQVK